MLRYYTKKSYNEEPQEVHAPIAGHTWLYGSGVTGEELESLSKDYDLNPSILADVRDTHELPRVEYDRGKLYVFARVPHQLASGAIASTPMLSIVTGTSLFTLSPNEYVQPQDIFDHVRFSMRSNQHVLLQLLSYVVTRYEQYIQQTGSYIHNTKRRLQTHEVDTKDFIKFVTVEADLNEYRTSLTALAAVLNRLHENRHSTFTDKDCELIEDISLHINQLLVSVESHTHAITSIRNAYTTISNNTLNRRMKTLTLITVLITLPNVIYGMFGMNVPLPLGDQPWAYAAITGLTIVIVTVAYLAVRRLRF